MIEAIRGCRFVSTPAGHVAGSFESATDNNPDCAKNTLVMPSLANLKANYFVQRKCLSFTGIPEMLPELSGNESFEEYKSRWELLGQHKYSDVHDGMGGKKYRNIRLNNYSFLDKIAPPKGFFSALIGKSDQKNFIDEYKKLTGFPHLGKVSKNIEKHFVDTIKKSSKELNKKWNTMGFDVIYAGYDPTCSVALGKALPGSDLDKAYIVIRGAKFDAPRRPNTSPIYNRSAFDCEKQYSDEFKGALWKNTDQRILSLNHKDSFPEVFTLQEIVDKLDIADKLAENISDYNALRYYKVLRRDQPEDLYKAATFNIDLAKEMRQEFYSREARAQMRDFAFFIEALRENKALKMLLKLDSENYGVNFPIRPDKFLDTETGSVHMELAKRLNKSLFFELSNISQIEAMKRKIKTVGEKDKIKARERIQYGFDSSGVFDDKFGLVTEIIRYSSEDQGPKYKQYFENDTDIAASYSKLLRVLTEGRDED